MRLQEDSGTIQELSMIISFRQLIGPAGPTMCFDLDTDSLSEEQRNEVLGLLAASGIEGVNGATTPASNELHQYEIIIEWGDTSAAFSCDHHGMPKSVRPLITYLTRHAQPVSLR